MENSETYYPQVGDLVRLKKCPFDVQITEDAFLFEKVAFETHEIVAVKERDRGLNPLVQTNLLKGGKWWIDSSYFEPFFGKANYYMSFLTTPSIALGGISVADFIEKNGVTNYLVGTLFRSYGGDATKVDRSVVKEDSPNTTLEDGYGKRLIKISPWDAMKLSSQGQEVFMLNEVGMPEWTRIGFKDSFMVSIIYGKPEGV